MIRLAVAVCAALVSAAPHIASAQATGPAPAPPAGGPGIYRDAAALARVLDAAAKASPALATSPVLITDRYSIQEARRGAAGPPAVHRGWSELHYILDGSGILATGGAIVPAGNGASARIEGGVARKVAKGDAIVIPPDTPHQYTAVDGALTYLEVRFPDPAAAGKSVSDARPGLGKP